MKVLIAVSVLFVLAVIAAKLTPRKARGTWPLYARKVLTAPEQALYWRLVEALPQEVVLAQVQLSRFLGVSKGNQRVQWLNRISQKSADFVICRKDFSVVAVIELDDSTHSRVSRQKADADKAKAINDGGLTLIRWSVKDLPGRDVIRAAVYPSQGTAVEVGEGAGGVPPAANASSALGTLPRRWR